MQYMKLSFFSDQNCLLAFECLRQKTTVPNSMICCHSFRKLLSFFSKGAKKLNHEKLCVSFLTQIFPSISIYLAKVNFFLASSIGTTKVFGKQNYRFRKHSYYSSTAVFATAVAAVLILVEHPQKLI